MIEIDPVQHRLVFLLTLPIDLAPRLNEVATRAMHWKKKKTLKTRIDAKIMDGMNRWPDWHAKFTTRGIVRKNRKGQLPTVERVGGKRRIARVTRNSSRRPDELAVDVLGGKLPIDQLVRAGVLVNDSHKWLERIALWFPAHLGSGNLVIEIFDYVTPSP